jgi:hypothetical protein
LGGSRAAPHLSFRADLPDPSRSTAASGTSAAATVSRPWDASPRLIPDSGSAPGSPLSSEDGTCAGRPGAATLDCVEDPKKRTANADQERRARLNQRLRQAFIEGAEVDMRRVLGRGLTAEELERVLR